jgi:hypothetical protein
MLNIQQLIPRHTSKHDPEAVHTFITTHLQLVLILSFLLCLSFLVDFFRLSFTTIFFFFYVLQTLTVHGITFFKNPVNSGTTMHEIKTAIIGLVFCCAVAQLTDVLCLILFPSS